MPTPPGFLQRNLQRVGHLVAGRRRHARAVMTSLAMLRVYRRWYFAGGENGARAARLGETNRLAAQKLVDLCARNGGAWIKAAQFFSCRPDVLPREYIEALQQLQNDAPPQPFARLRPVLDARWGEGWQDRFTWFDEKPVATASLAQVHRACLQDGRVVAVKIRLPGVVESFRQDEVTGRVVAGMLAPLVRELDLAQVVDQLLRLTADELDFRNELRNLQRFAALPHRPRIRVPQVYPELCAEDVLITGWVEGERLRDFLDHNPSRAPDLLTELFQSYIQQVTQFGVYQADAHPGNFIVNADGIVTILDFGALAELTDEERRNYAALLFACVTGQTDNIGELFERAGFVGGKSESLQNLASYVLTDRLKQDGLSESMIDLLELFREKRVKIPDSYINIARVLITVGGFLMNYNVPFAWLPPAPADQPA
jgi:ubiquinone biosynthesis protein